MNAQSQFIADTIAAGNEGLLPLVEELRERNQQYVRALDEALLLLSMEGDRRDREGRDALALKAFVTKTRKELWS